MYNMYADTWSGTYEYKGFTIWSPSQKLWLAEPNFKEQIAIDHYKGSIFRLDHKTIAQAKAWVREVGVNLQEADFLEYSNVKQWTKENNPYV